MNTEVARSQAQALEDWARMWSGDGAEGASEVAFLMQRAARMINRAMGLPDADGIESAKSLDEARRVEPGQGAGDGDQPEQRTEIRD